MSGVIPCSPTLSAKSSDHRHQRGQERRLEAGELNALLAATYGTIFSSLIHLAVETAMRAGELLFLRGDNVNFEKQTALLPDTKNGERRIVPLSSKAVAIVRSIERTSDTVFPPTASYSVSNAFKRATKRAGIELLARAN